MILNEYLYCYYQKLPNTNLLSVFRRITEINPENWLQRDPGILSCSMSVSSNICTFPGAESQGDETYSYPQNSTPKIGKQYNFY